MKKVFITLMASLALVFGVASCQCGSEQKPVEPAVEVDTLTVENTVSMDKEQMFLKYSEDYRYFETTAILDNYLDADTTHAFVSAESVFQALYEKEQSTDTKVVIFTHELDGTSVQEYEHSFWFDDNPLNDEEIKLTFADAVERALEANCPKPHTRYVVLRKQVGPVAANPQYIFGKAKLYVDAVTGNVSETNPAFDAKGFKMPLGEWP